MTTDVVNRLLCEGLTPIWQRMDRNLLEELANGFKKWPAANQPMPADFSDHGWLAERLAEYLVHEIEQTSDAIQALEHRFVEFSKVFGHAATDEERQHHVINFAVDLGANSRQIAGDRRAFSRWFGYEAIADRYRRRHAARERRLTFLLKRLGYIAGLSLSENGPVTSYKDIWQHLHIESAVKPFLVYMSDSRVRAAAFDCMSMALKTLPDNVREESVDVSTLQFIYRSALAAEQDVWIQCEAMMLLGYLSPESLHTVLDKRLSVPRGGDDLFVRHRAVLLLGNNIAAMPELSLLLDKILSDPSPYVRQALAEILVQLSDDDISEIIPKLVNDDDAPQVRAATLLALPVILTRNSLIPLVESLLADVLDKERDVFVLRVALKIVFDGYCGLREQNASAASSWLQALTPLLDVMHRTADDLSLRRWAAQTRERLWCESTEQASSLRHQLEQELEHAGASGEQRSVKLNCDNEDTFGRVLATLSQNDFGFDVETNESSRKIARGDRFGFRLWRLLHELRHSATDKRQAFRHTIGRIYRGTMRAPSGVLAELSQTNVPGEPVYLAEEDGARSYLPLVDEVLSSLDQELESRTVFFYTSEGVTELQPPSALGQRLLARAQLTLHFARYARLRNWKPNGKGDPVDYSRALQRLGFQIRFRPHQYESNASWSADSSVKHFFPAVIPLTVLDFWTSAKDYFFSVYENSVYELGVFLMIAISLFIGAHWISNHRIHQSRNRLPLVIGGWGTRGKSGTERMKAALFSALGYDVFSKTTGCEAMFIHG
ncbi:MAG: HEAT repeat domain-containing protein, partial [Acidiferrobacterales bacterium]